MTSANGGPECCPDIRLAMKDGVVTYSNGHGTEIVSVKGSFPVNNCPWCGAEVPRGLYTMPSMLYRP